MYLVGRYGSSDSYTSKRRSITRRSYHAKLGLHFAIAVIIHYANVPIPYVHSGFVILLIGYLVLLAGNVLEGV